MNDNKNAEALDNWAINPGSFLSEYGIDTALFIQGEVDGKKIKTDILLWFDPDSRIAMTTNKIFHVREPDKVWLSSLLASGNSIYDLKMTGTNH